MEKILSGKPVAQVIKENILNSIDQYQIKPQMALLQIGNDPASSFYVQNIIKTGAKLGCNVQLLRFDDFITQSRLIEEISAINKDSLIHGIMLQKPFPNSIDEKAVNLAIAPDKDIDGIHPYNLGKILTEEETFFPCTAAAVIELFKFYNISTQGKEVVILGRSAVVGKPLSNMLLYKGLFGNATVTVCHSKTTNLPVVTRRADILIAAIGSSNFVNQDMIKSNAILIDVGINEIKLSDGKSSYTGDIDYESCFDKCQAITPVPGGIGTITTSILFANLVKSAILHCNS